MRGGIKIIKSTFFFNNLHIYKADAKPEKYPIQEDKNIEVIDKGGDKYADADKK